MEPLEKLLFAFLRRSLGSGQEVAVDEESIPALYVLSHRHGLAHLVAHALQQSSICLSGSFQDRLLEACYRQERYAFAFEELSALFQRENIPFIPLKGLVLQQFYPEPWMRTGCDMDLLLKPEDLQRAGDALEDKLGYQPKGMSDHDIALISADGVRVELHHTLIKDDPVLAKPWEHCRQGQLEGAYAYLYHIAHTAKHLRHGGCGIRPVLDLWLMERQGITCPDELLEQCGLLVFRNALRRLSKCWFENGQMDDSLVALHRYILDGGSFGTQESANYLRPSSPQKRFFISKQELQYTYPILRRQGWLLPACQLRRWGTLLRTGTWRRPKADPQQRQAAQALMEQLKLPPHRG